MKFKLVANYVTGDSFNTDTVTEDILNDITYEAGLENLERIKQHWNWYKDKNRSWGDSNKSPRPEWHTSKYDDELILKVSIDKTVKISAPWCGYFERLNYVTVELDMPKVEF